MLVGIIRLKYLDDGNSLFNLFFINKMLLGKLNPCAPTPLMVSLGV